MGRDKVWFESRRRAAGGTGGAAASAAGRRRSSSALRIPSRFDEVIARLPVPATVVADVHPGAGPLAGLHAGLIRRGTSSRLAVATDMPFVDPRVVRAHARACCGAAMRSCRASRRPAWPSPNPSRCTRSIARAACRPSRRRCRGDRRRVVSFLRDVSVCYLDEDILRHSRSRARCRFAM